MNMGLKNAVTSADGNIHAICQMNANRSYEIITLNPTIGDVIRRIPAGTYLTMQRDYPGSLRATPDSGFVFL